MKKITKIQVERILNKRGLDPKVGWFYIQFIKKFEKEYIIEAIKLKAAANNLVKFLESEKINEVLFFPEPSFDFNIPYGIIRRTELKKFLEENVNIVTNTHVADKKLSWIFTITHEDDFFISGTKKITKKFVSFFKDAKCTLYEELKAKLKK